MAGKHRLKSCRAEHTTLRRAVEVVMLIPLLRTSWPTLLSLLAVLPRPLHRYLRPESHD